MALIDFKNSGFVFSLFPNLLTVEKPQENIDVNKLVEVIKYGYIKEPITNLRNAGSKEKYDSIKKELIPCVTLSGTFTRRALNGFVNHSGLMQVDLDKVGDYTKTFDLLSRDKYVYVCFRSPGGQGIKAVVKVNPSSETHKSQFLALEKYFNDEYDIEIDSLCKDVSRAMLLSHDPDIFCNPCSDVFPEMFAYKKATGSEKPFKSSKDKSHPEKVTPYFTVFDIDKIERLIYEVHERRIDLTSTYKDWIKIGYALCSEFGEPGRKYFHDLGNLYPGYRREETDRKYTELLKTNTGQSTIRSIYYLADKAGI